MSTQLPAPAWKSWHDDKEPIRIGVSTCLLGQKVRYDGGHKRNHYLNEVLGRWMTWVPVCPEMEIGLGVPRPTIRLEHSRPTPRLVEPKGTKDLTERMEEFSIAKVEELRRAELDGYVLKNNSPSCGMERVKVFGKGGVPSKNGVGIFARILMEKMPNLPVEEEGRLNDPGLRERFIQHVFCRHRWRTMIGRGSTRANLIAFHTAHKLILRSHNEAGYRRLGRIVASAGTISDEQLFDAYESEMSRCLQTQPSTKRNANVLYHALGYLKRLLEPIEKQETVQLIEDYRNELVPLIVPITLFRHHITKHGVPYLQGQLYFEPHPKELMLRNRV